MRTRRMKSGGVIITVLGIIRLLREKYLSWFACLLEQVIDTAVSKGLLYELLLEVPE